MHRHPHSSFTPFSCLALMLLMLLSACARTSSHGAERYFEGKALELAIAAEQGDAATITRLIKTEGVNPDKEFSKQDGIPLIAWPLRAQNLEGLRAMLDNGADPNARRIETLDGETFRHNNAMVYAAKMDDPRYLALLLDHGGDPDTRTSNTETLLFQAFISGNLWKNIQLLVERGAHVNESNIGQADTVLSWYTGRGGFEQAYWLLEHGADPTIASPSSAQPGAPDRTAMVEAIYWEITTPDLLPWQKKCQQWLIDHGIARPPLPQYIREKREAFGFPAKEQDIPPL